MARRLVAELEAWAKPAERVAAPSEAEYRAAYRRILALTAKAKTDPVAFFELVMRDECTQRPIRCLPHQRVFFEFARAHPKCVILMPAGSSKTFCTAAFLLWLLGNDPTLRGIVVSATSTQARKPLGLVRDYIPRSSQLRLAFP